MTGIILGTLFILGGLGWFFVTFIAGGMASRPTTPSENVLPFLGLVPVLIGVALIVFR